MRRRIRNYRDIMAWEQAIELAVQCDIICDRLPRHAFKLALQIRTAANSVHANIAEGNGRPSTLDYLRHLGYSQGSLNEIGSNLAFIEKRYRDIRTDKAEELVRITEMLLTALVKSLRRKRDRRSRS